MKDKTALVVTSIARPNEILRALARGCAENGYDFIVIGDEASPPDFEIDGCDFYSLARQRATDFKFARLCPTRHYARKNIGYLVAMRDGASVIVETDDDNIAGAGFWAERGRIQRAAVTEESSWVNVYRYFTSKNIWPRGFPLERVREDVPSYESLKVMGTDCPIQQSLVDENPDVDAVYRLVLPLPQIFAKGLKVALGKGSWCPFNSQNTRWWREAFALLYLPSYCSFRMTDIWRSFVAQRIAWASGWRILFDEATMRQERNEHSLLRDFEDEIPGYLHNEQIREALATLALKAGKEAIAENLRVCYEKLVSISVIGAEELRLLDMWLEDIERLS